MSDWLKDEAMRLKGSLEELHPLYNKSAHADRGDSTEGKFFTGYYESDGMCWNHGEIPKCKYCDATADKDFLYETHTQDIVICGNGECASMYISEEFCHMPVELIDDGEAPCIQCDVPTDAKGKEDWVCDDCEEELAEEHYVEEIVKAEGEK